MTELQNSVRKLFRATYTPLKSSPIGKVGIRSHEIRSLFSLLIIENDELEALKEDPDLKLNAKEARQAFRAIDTLISEDSMGAISSDSIEISKVSLPFLTSICNKILKIREKELESFRDSYDLLVQKYFLEQDKRYERHKTRSLSETRKTTKNLERKASEEIHDSISKKGNLAIVPNIATTLSQFLPSLRTILEWSIEKKIIKSDSIRRLKVYERDLNENATKMDYENLLVAKVQSAWFATKLIQQLRFIEPVGLLHLERINFVPAGIERGELVYSVPLSPAEEVNITHKEWSNTSEEFSKIVNDFQEAYSEEGVTEKTDFSQSTNSQEQHSSGFNTGVTASGGYGPISISTTLGLNVSSSASNSEQTAINHSVSITRKSSSRVRKEHKMSFKVASALGSEDQQIRKIKNPFIDRAVRVDYYQLVRKWRVELYRYGIRLTYDLTIPEPGSDIIDKIKKVEELRNELENTELQFDLLPQEISIDMNSEYYYQKLAAKWGAEDVEPFPDAWTLNLTHNELAIFEQAETAYTQYRSFKIVIPPEYYYGSILVWGPNDPSRIFPSDEYIEKGLTPSVTLLNPTETEMHTGFSFTSGEIVFVVSSIGAERYDLTVTIDCPLRPAIFQKWQMDVWRKCRQAAESNLEKKRQVLNEQITRLTQELGAQDPLSLRKIEREEVMKSVLRWIFGPSFEFVPEGIDPELYEKTTKKVKMGKEYMKVVEQGHHIQFLHHAIEWENMLYFLYPYFWSHPSRWDLKKYLNHPDLMHRAFLKSGAARVVLTIRPGFEQQFISYIQTHNIEPSKSNDHYLSIAQEMQAYANINYPGIRPANMPECARLLLFPEQKKTWNDMQKIIALLQLFFDDKGRYPTTQEGLSVLKDYGELVSQDAWGNDFIYTCPGLHGDFDLISTGADGKLDEYDESGRRLSKEIDSDITNWAEASLISSWYDYTPTSALDIAFDEVMPNA
jgi:hypothetical protein